MTTTLSLLRTLNEKLAIAAGLLLLASVMITLFDIVARPLGLSLGGTDELSGYAMAIVTSWGVSYALTCLAHVRIDLLRERGTKAVRAWFDAVSILSLAGVAVTVAYRGWPVLEKSIQSHSRANTTLETPLWIPQSLWMAGWAWFAFSAVILAVSVCMFLAGGRHDDIDEFAGSRGEA
ncbi:TRAP transporter small permease subunit [Pukyongiella litopenaei]|uniref:TRAP transporter small permease protein n=1 Tax=Pukyongiella litopenaei TaxID=2605946 RepID=A0A2S0MMP8_9RHOB|nr:TRAP transporter small permease [Pukyongiella litopenaei]AVO37158.1 TRAP transporter small permease [Pukyongiella litopenaei]